MLSNVIVKPTGVLKLFFDHPNLTWEHVNNFTSRPLTNTTKGPDICRHALLYKFRPNWYGFLPLFIPVLFQWSSSYELLGITNKKPVVHFRSYGNRRRRFFRFIKQRSKNLVCFYLIYRYSLFWSLLTLPWRFYRINAARSTWTRNTLFRIYSSTSRQFIFYSTSSRPRRFNFGHWFTNDFIGMGRRYYYKSTGHISSFEWVYFRCASY